LALAIVSVNQYGVLRPLEAYFGETAASLITHAYSSSPEHEQIRTVGVAVTLTGCKGTTGDGAAVLQYSILKQQRRLRLPSRYRYHFYAIHHPTARECAAPLADLNFTLLEREVPVRPQDIRGEFLRENIDKGGTCAPFGCFSLLPRLAFGAALVPLRRRRPVGVARPGAIYFSMLRSLSLSLSRLVWHFLPGCLFESPRLLRSQGAAQVRGLHPDAARRDRAARHGHLGG
jgi:hypothetical protein